MSFLILAIVRGLVYRFCKDVEWHSEKEIHNEAVFFATNSRIFVRVLQDSRESDESDTNFNSHSIYVDML